MAEQNKNNPEPIDPPTEIVSTEDSLDAHSIDWLDLSTHPLLNEYPFDFGQYEILEELGKGGMGVVYKGLQKDLDRLVSIKLILSKRLLSWKNVVRFRREAKAAASVRHPNIVGIYEAGKVLGQHYIAMEYIEGVSLAKKIRGEKISEEEAVRIVGRVARAIAHLHSKNIVHLDLKPSNILIDKNGEPYVTDFGLARGLGGSGVGKDTEAISGTPCYMAPEQARGDESEIGTLCDVYGLGAVLYELLTRTPPFKNEDPFETLIKVIEADPVPPRKTSPEISKTLEKVCLRCLEKDPEKRYPSSDELAEDLDRYLAGDVVESAATSMRDQLKCWMRNKPALASHLIVLAFFCGIELLWFHLLKIRTADYHYPLLSILISWGISALGFDWLHQKPNRQEMTPFIWAGADVLFLTAALLNDGGITSHLLILYPILLAASGLWFQIRLVWLITGVTLLSYTYLVAHAYFNRPDIPIRFDQHFVFLAALFSVGFLISLLVRRLDLLLRYGRRIPAPIQTHKNH